MKASRILATLIAASAVISFTQCSAPAGMSQEFPARWIFTERNTPLYAANWTSDEHFINAMNGSPARISAVRADERRDIPFEYKDINGNPYISTLAENDYILFSVPVRRLEKGSAIEVEAALISNPMSPKYFTIEYFEDGKWKTVKDDLKEIPENPEMKYTFRCSGIGEGEHHEYTSIYQTIRLAKDIKDNELKVRFRATGGYTCCGKPQDAEAKDGAIGFVHHGFNGAYMQNYGTGIPRDTVKVLCLGNSFTYFSNVPSMLKEIAWSQGHYFNINAHLKGGRTIGQHLGLILSAHTIEYGDYDVAFLQDQSQNPARFAADPKSHAHVPSDFAALSEMVLRHSPDCRIIMEHTWAYPSQRFGGFGDFETFTRLLHEGSQAMAATNGSEVSPIGKGFEIVYNENKGIRLYDTDNKHQSHYGAYLKACVNYLIITGERFSGNVACCGIEPDKAAYLQSAAERAVFI